MHQIKLLDKAAIKELSSILRMKSVFNQDDFLNELSNYTVYLEYWSCDTGHAWESIALKQSTEDKDYADLVRSVSKKIGELNFKEILSLIWEIERQSKVN